MYVFMYLHILTLYTPKSWNDERQEQVQDNEELAVEVEEPGLLLESRV